MTISVKKVEDSELCSKGVELFESSRMNADEKENAAKTQDAIRKKISRWNGAAEIKKWRQRK
jgi:hypothetical protein